MSRVRDVATNEPKMRRGMNGNYYVYCKLRAPMLEVASHIGRAPSAVYWSDLGVWAMRVKNNKHKVILKGLFGQNDGQLTLGVV